MKITSLLFFILSSIFSASPNQAATKVEFENQQIKVRIATNPPQPISAFYEGRKFQKNMIDILKQQCFVSIFIHNKSDHFIWLDLSQWQFNNSDGKISRLDRHYWKTKWQEMNIPVAHQSTFRWTLLPEKLDFHPDEKEGGNILLPRLGKPFNFTARFYTGKDKKGTPINLKFNNMTCATDKQ